MPLDVVAVVVALATLHMEHFIAVVVIVVVGRLSLSFVLFFKLAAIWRWWRCLIVSFYVAYFCAA